tara:strand:- start:1415 stop:1654 length:240 start_codon:yes stop_codon:yes gene_type:complete
MDILIIGNGAREYAVAKNLRSHNLHAIGNANNLCPPHHNKLDMLTNLNSTLQCPSYVPVMTCLNPINVALCCKKILAFI